MKRISKIEAKSALDSLIEKSRVHLYKPIQIAEILYQHRKYQNIDLLNLEEYRTQSKKWRDIISIELLGRKCTSSAKFQDNLFDKNAIPPELLNVLGRENINSHGAVEAYIYKQFTNKYAQLSLALNYLLEATPQKFSIQQFVDSFWKEAGLKRSIDKIYEIIVYALFSTLVEALNLKIDVFINEKSLPILREFEDFSKKVMCINSKKLSHIQDAMVYRVGVINAADRGLDMYSNWGPAIQIKHLCLDTELAKNIVTNISSDRIIIVCKDAEKSVIVSLLTQIGWKSRIQSIVTENELFQWYEKALRGKFSKKLASKLLTTLIEEIKQEFPAVNEMPAILKQRHYEKIKDIFWS